MKLLALLLCFLSSSLAFSAIERASALGNEKGNGGDSCEQRIKEISSDIQKWIMTEDFQGMKFPSSLSEKEYKEKMLETIKKSPELIGALLY